MKVNIHKEHPKLSSVWRALRQRCKNPNDVRYSSYGGRGISVCAEWDTFVPFLEWALNNGYQEGLSIDRIDNDGDYEPSNCRWATPIQQMGNRTNTSKYGVGIRKTKWGRFEVYGPHRTNKAKFLGSYKDLELAQLIRNEYVEGYCA